jgi:F-type H+-transporting ATPase subunit delta
LNNIAKRYARTLYELSLERRELEQAEADILVVKKLLRGDSGFREFVLNPLVKYRIRMDTIRKIFEDKLSDFVLNFLLFLCSKRRLAELESIIFEFKKLLMEYRNQAEGELISAFELDPLQVDQIHRKVETATGKKVFLKRRVQSDIIGGFVVRVGDRVIDSSIRYQLNILRERLKTR